MKKIWKIRIREIISISLLIIGGSVFLLSLPALFVITLAQIVKDDPEYDSEGKLIYNDDRHTLHSFGNRRQFSIEKCGATEISVYLIDRDENKEIDDIKNFTLSSVPHIYTFGKKGYTKLNYETGEIIQSENINYFSQEDQEIFKDIENYSYVNELNEKRNKRQRND